MEKGAGRAYAEMIERTNSKELGNFMRKYIDKKSEVVTDEWRDVVRIMNTQKMVTTTVENQYNQKIIIRQCSEPDEQVKKI